MLESSEYDDWIRETVMYINKYTDATTLCDDLVPWLGMRMSMADQSKARSTEGIALMCLDDKETITERSNLGISKCNRAGLNYLLTDLSGSCDGLLYTDSMPFEWNPLLAVSASMEV